MQVAKAMSLHELECPSWQLQKCTALRRAETDEVTNKHNATQQYTYAI